MDPGFPFYGKFELKLQGSLNGSAHDLLHNRENIWIYPEYASNSMWTLVNSYPSVRKN